MDESRNSSWLKVSRSLFLDCSASDSISAVPAFSMHSSVDFAQGPPPPPPTPPALPKLSTGNRRLPSPSEVISLHCETGVQVLKVGSPTLLKKANSQQASALCSALFFEGHQFIFIAHGLWLMSAAGSILQTDVPSFHTAVVHWYMA